MKNDYIIGLFLKYINKQEEYEKENKKSFVSLQEEFFNCLANMNTNELLDLFIKYTSINSLEENKDIHEFLGIIYEIYLEKIEKLSFMETLDLYVKVFNNVYGLELELSKTQNILNSRVYNLEDDYYLEREAKKNRLTKEDFLKKYRADLELFKEDVNKYNRVFVYIDCLQNDMLIELERKIVFLQNNENKEEIITVKRVLNEKIEKNSEEILKRRKFLRDKDAIDRFAKLNEVSIYELVDSLDYSELDNEVTIYESYRNTLMNEKKNTL